MSTQDFAFILTAWQDTCTGVQRLGNEIGKFARSFAIKTMRSSRSRMGTSPIPMRCASTSSRSVAFCLDVMKLSD